MEILLPCHPLSLAFEFHLPSPSPSSNRYVETVYPELELPSLKDPGGVLIPSRAAEKKHLRPWYDRPRQYTGAFRLRLKSSNWCAEPGKGHKARGSKLVLARCSDSREQVRWRLAMACGWVVWKRGCSFVVDERQVWDCFVVVFGYWY